ncbi:MAG: DUF2335 domain-containing protein [Pirellulales bacterium]|nr:DUF2335 domain-containing protein [Pirellulales bacterium]
MAKLTSQVIVDEGADPTTPVVSTSYTLAYSGPIPPPEVLARYEEVVPGTAAQIIDWANRQAVHRQQLEKLAVSSELRRSHWGLGLGFVVAMSAILGGVYCILQGHDWAGASLVGGSLVSLVTSFIVGTNSRKAERLEKSRMLTSEKTRRIRQS